MKKSFSPVVSRILLSLFVLGLTVGVFLKYTQPAKSQDRGQESDRVSVSANPLPVSAKGPTGPIFARADRFAESPAIRDIVEYPGLVYDKEDSWKYRESLEEREINMTNTEAIRTVNDKVRPDMDGAYRPSLMKALAPNVLPAPSLVFDGVSNGDNSTLFGFRLSPPDTEGDVGPNHYVQVVNLAMRIYNKATGTPTGPAVKFSSVFAALGAPCGNQDGGDPIVLYDPLADRWMLSQFCFPSGSTTPPYFEEIAVSKTNDPTGAYYLYSFPVSAGNNEFPDYPHLGVWSDGYYMTTNQFLNGGTFDGGGVFAFDRVKMLSGDPTAGFIYFNRNLATFPEGQAGVLPADMDGIKPPPAGMACPFAYFTANEFGDPADGIRIFDFHADFATPANSTFIERPESSAVPGGGIPVAPFNPLAPAGRDAVLQPAPASATTARLDAISDRLMHRLQYINFGSSESLVVTNTVNVGADQTLANYRAGVRYYQLRRLTPGSGAFLVNEQGTFAGGVGDTTHRWMGSAAMNAAGDLTVGFSASSSTVFPSMRYAARFSGDLPGSLAQGEQDLFVGTGVQTDTGSRWGDYSNLSLDPSDDCTYWFTSETYTAASQATSGVGWLTKVAKFNLGTPCNAFPRGTISGTITNCATSAPLDASTVQAAGGYVRTTGAPGTYTMTVAPGTYNVSASKSGGFTTATSTGNVVAAGGTATVNLCLGGIPVLASGASAPTLIAESFTPNGAIDPGETVTVRFPARNTGAINTVNDVGTLQATGGVQTPSGPQNYGVIVAGGPDKTADFTFKANPALACGAPITATVAHNDGGSLGNLVYTLPTGATGAPVTVSYTGPAVAVPDNVPAGVNVPLNVSGLTGNTSDVNFKLDGTACSATVGSTTVGMDHTFVGDLIFKLTAPNGGPTLSLMNRPGGTGNSGNNFCQTVLDDQAPGGSLNISAITAAGNPYSGTFFPQAPLSGYNSFNPNGTWTLNVSDIAAVDTGSVRAFSLIITPKSCTVAPTAAGVQVGGRVLSTDGRGLTNARVTLTDAAGKSQTVTTTRRGGFIFEDVEPGTYVISIGSRRYSYQARVFQVQDNVTDLVFYPEQ